MSDNTTHTTAAADCYPLQVAMRLRNYEDCHDGDVDEAANLIVRMHQLLASVYDQCGNHRPPQQRAALKQTTRDSIRDLLYG